MKQPWSLPVVAVVLCTRFGLAGTGAGDWVGAAPAAQMHGVQIEAPDTDDKTIGHCDHGDWGGVSRALALANRDGSGDVHGESLGELKPHLLPWHPIPLDLMGPYDE